MYVVVVIFMIISAVIAFGALMPLMNLNFDVYSIVVLVISGLMTFLLWRNKDTLRTEYEYSLTNGEMDFAKVMGNSRRKHLLTLQLKTVEQGGPVDSDAFVRLANTPNVKHTDLTINNDTPHYFLYYSRDGVRNLIVLEPSEELVNMMRLYNRNFAA
jgi:hypothetical protein